jgi:glucan endo-1,3-beta-D-glucosidase
MTQVTWAPTSSIAGAIVPSGAVVPSGAALPSGAAMASGSNGVIGGPSGTTLASSWAANQTPGAAGATASPSAYKGAGVKVGGSVALALGAAAAALL